MYEVDIVRSTTNGAGMVPASTTGSARSHSMSERTPCRAMLGGIGDEKSRSQDSTTVSTSLMSVSRK